MRVFVNGELVGHVFTCRWKYGGGDGKGGGTETMVCWVTQLVVHREYRRRGLATGLLREVRRDGGDGDDVYGVASSHPAAILAVARACSGGMFMILLERRKEKGKASEVREGRDARGGKS